MADYPNGRIPSEALTALSVGGSLLSGAAASFERWRSQATAAGRELTITSVADAYRSFQQQYDVFVARYEVVAGNGPYNDVRVYEGRRYVRLRGAAAAVPGTSNHGRGIAIDVKNAGAFGGSFHTWLSATGPALGWTNHEGRSVDEPWHWVYGGSTTTPNPPTSEEDDMTPAQAAQLTAILDLLTPGVEGVKFDGDIFKRLARIEDTAVRTRADVATVHDSVLRQK